MKSFLLPSTPPPCQTEPSCTFAFIGGNDPRLLPADQSHVNACCSDETVMGCFLEKDQRRWEAKVFFVRQLEGLNRKKDMYAGLWSLLPPPQIYRSEVLKIILGELKCLFLLLIFGSCVKAHGKEQLTLWDKKLSMLSSFTSLRAPENSAVFFTFNTENDCVAPEWALPPFLSL